jgi:pimeloyl-ACP methyl ester carboxylesterase/SAM-dependent methyltransferase
VQNVTVNGVRLAYEERGAGDETVVLSHSYVVDHRHFDAQIEALSQHYRVLAYDHRGHGQSEAPADGYDLETLYRDAEAFIETVAGGPCHFVGLSTGGFIGLRLGFRRPDLLKRLVVMDTSADAEPLLKRLKYEGMFAVLDRAGFAPLLDRVMPIMFGPAFLEDPARADERALWRERFQENPPEALIKFGRGIFARDSVADRLADVRVPTMVMVGEHDVAQPPFRAERIADGIDGAVLCYVPAGGHLCTIENPDAVNEALLSFLADGTVDAQAAARRTPRSTLYDGSAYGRLVEPLLAGVHGIVAERLPDGERVLDACCGTGGLGRRLSADGRDVVGVDLSPDNIAYAKSHSDSSRLSFEVGDVSQLAYDDDAFDAATIVMALHEMPAGCREPVLRELGRVARKVVAVDFNAPMPRNVAGLRNRAMEMAAGGAHFRAFRDYSRRGGLPALLAGAGLRVESERLIDDGTLRVQTLVRV